LSTRDIRRASLKIEAFSIGTYIPGKCVSNFSETKLLQVSLMKPYEKLIEPFIHYTIRNLTPGITRRAGP
jgi:hypothetical protein